MALRASWEGFLRLSLISVPVRAYNAAVSGGGDIHFHQLHKGCGNRIRYQKVCPVHGEVTKEEIVSGYEYAKGKHVEIEPQELAELKSEQDEAINIDAFVEPTEINETHLSGKTFYLVPSGPAGQKPYALLHQVMLEKKRHAIATVVLSGHDEAVLIRPVGKLLAMSVLLLADQVKNPSAFEDELGDAKLTSQEMKLAATLVDASTAEEFDFARYKDHYTERVASFLEAKTEGKEVTAPVRDKTPNVINLMDALRKSVTKAQGARRARPAPAPRPERSPGRRKTG